MIRGGKPISALTREEDLLSSQTEIARQMHAESRVRMPLVRRLDYLLALCADSQRVAHVGCADSPFTAERLDTGRLLHDRLAAATQVDGFDVDEDAIARLTRQRPGARFVVADIASAVPEECEGRYDLVIAGEVLEHVPNIGAFLAGCRGLLGPGGILCVTVPNACAPKVAARAVVGWEVVHPDHYVYFSPRTLTRALASGSFHVEDLATYLSDADWQGHMFNVLLRAAHAVWRGPVGDGLIAVARPI